MPRNPASRYYVHSLYTLQVFATNLPYGAAMAVRTELEAQGHDGIEVQALPLRDSTSTLGRNFS